MAKGKIPTQEQHRSSETGRWVTERYAERHKSTTETERVKHPERSK